MKINIVIDKANIWGTIQEWVDTYSDKQEELYSNNIDEKQFKDAHIELLFQWKNQSNLSEKKKKSLNDNILSKIAVINELKKQFDDQKFDQYFGKVSAVWQIFLKHIIAPNTYPIYDQNIHRVYHLYLQNEKWQGIDETLPDRAKIEFYNSYYLPFVHGICTKHSSEQIKTLDKGMFTLGQALKRIEKLYEAYQTCIRIESEL